MGPPVSQTAPRPGSTPSTTPTAISARAKTPAPGQGPTTRRTAPKRPSSQQQAFAAAEKDFPDVDAAIAFLRQHTLIPEGDAAVTEASLVTGLLHFAFASPSNDLARKGLIAFAFLARELFKQNTADTIAAAVAERAEEQLTLRLDEHTTQMESKLEEVVGGLEDAKKEVGECAGRLKEACEWMKQAEAALTAARTDFQAAGTSVSAGGALPSHAPALTIDTAPARTRRAVNLADLLRRQVLVRGATLDHLADQRPSDADVLEKARDALNAVARDGLTLPKEGAIDSAKTLAHGDIVFTASSVSMAKWLALPAVAAAFSRKLGLKAHIVERTFKLVAERVPVEFDPSDSAGLRAVEEAHGLQAGAIMHANWIKPVAKRSPGQRAAFLLLTMSGVQQANVALKGLMFAGRRVLVRRDVEEPKRCAKCQRYDGHFARDCPAEHDTCATCAGAHLTSQCTVGDPGGYRCANCKEDGHAAWDHGCPVLRAKVRALSMRRADTGFRFFVTDNPETWVSDEEELARAPPPPTVWSQIRHRFDDSTAPPRRTQRQARLDGYLSQPAQPSPPRAD